MIGCIGSKKRCHAGYRISGGAAPSGGSSAHRSTWAARASTWVAFPSVQDAVRRRHGRLSRAYEFEVEKAGCLSWVRPNGTCVDYTLNSSIASAVTIMISRPRKIRRNPQCQKRCIKQSSKRSHSQRNLARPLLPFLLCRTHERQHASMCFNGPNLANSDQKRL